MSKTTYRRKLTTLLFLVFVWGGCLLGLTGSALAHESDRRRVAALEKSVIEHVSANAVILPTLEARIARVEDAQVLTAKSVIDIKMTLAYGIGAIAVLQLILNLQPWKLLGGRPA